MPALFIKLPNWMGDILFSYDLLYSLSRHFDRLGLCVSSDHEELFSIFPIPNAEIISYPPQSWPHWEPETIKRVEDFKADFGLVLPNSIGSALVLRWAGISPLYGYDHEHRGFLLARSLKAPKHRMHQNEYYLELLKLFDFEAQRYPIANSENRERIAIIHPGASKMERAWQLERFVEIAGNLKDQGFEVIFISGDRIADFGFPVLVKPQLAEFATLLKECTVFIGNDSGPLHLAQQCGAKVVGIYGPGDPKITGLRDVSQGETIFHFFPCSPCRQKFFRECSPSENGKPFCIETITTGEVWSAVEKILKDGTKHRPSGMDVKI